MIHWYIFTCFILWNCHNFLKSFHLSLVKFQLFWFVFNFHCHCFHCFHLLLVKSQLFCFYFIYLLGNCLYLLLWLLAGATHFLWLLFHHHLISSYRHFCKNYLSTLFVTFEATSQWLEHIWRSCVVWVGFWNNWDKLFPLQHKTQMMGSENLYLASETLSKHWRCNIRVRNSWDQIFSHNIAFYGRHEYLDNIAESIKFWIFMKLLRNRFCPKDPKFA